MEEYAVVVGVQHYDPGLGSLPGAINDAVDIHHWLTSEEGKHLKAANCKLLTSESDLTSVIIDEMGDAILEQCEKAAQLDGEKRFYFFFSGHGFGVDANEIALILSNWREGTTRSVAADGWRQSILDRGAFTEVLFFLDCCRSRKVSFKPSNSALLYNARPHEDVSQFNWMKAAATSYMDSAYERNYQVDGEVRRNGFFTRALLEALKGAAANELGQITLSSLKTYVKDRTSEISRQHDDNQKAEIIFKNDVVLHTVAPPNSGVIMQFDALDNKPYTVHTFRNSELVLLAEYEGQDSAWNLDLPKGLYMLKNKVDEEQLFAVKTGQKTLLNVTI